MSKSVALEESRELLNFMKADRGVLTKKKAKRFLTYKLGLCVHDIVIYLLSFGLASIYYQSPLTGSDAFGQPVFLSIMSLSFFTFFSSSGLYNYHLIFKTTHHIRCIVKSFFWIFLTLSMVSVLYIWPLIYSNIYLLTAILLVAVLLLISGKFYREQVPNFIKSLGISFLIVGLIGLCIPGKHPIEYVNVFVIPLGFCLFLLVLSLSRCGLVNIVFSILMRRHFRRQSVIVGTNGEAKAISNHIIKIKAPYWVVGVIGDGRLTCRIPKDCIGALNDVPHIVEKHGIEEIIVTDENIDKRELVSLLDFCTTAGLTVWFPPKLMPIIHTKLHIDNFCGLQMIRLCSQKNTWLFNKTKHAMDALMTLPVFIFQLPIFLAIAAAIKLDSKGPVFYKATAIGKGSKSFQMYKFRSMRTDISSDIHKDYVTKLITGEIKNHHDGTPLKIVNDPRVTRVGKIIRKLSLDELPQLINVLKGEMSLVGPRPCLPYEFEVYEDWHKKRTQVRPGITGLWQVTGRSEVDFEDMMLLDFYYIYNRNFLFDLNILYETLFVIFGKKGAY